VEIKLKQQISKNWTDEERRILIAAISAPAFDSIRRDNCCPSLSCLLGQLQHINLIATCSAEALELNRASILEGFIFQAPVTKEKRLCR